MTNNPLDPTSLPLFTDVAPPNYTGGPTSPATAPTAAPAPDSTRRGRRAGTPRASTLPASTAGEDPRFWGHVTTMRAATSRRLEGHDLKTTDPEEVRAVIEDVVRGHVSDIIRAGGAGWDADYSRRVKTAVFDAILGLGRFQPLVDDPDVENIAAFGHDRVILAKADGSEVPGPPVAESNEDLIEDIQRLATRYGRTWTEATPFLDLALPGRVRLHASRHATQGFPIIQIRIHRLHDADLTTLREEHGEFDLVIEEFLRAAVRAGKSIVVSGARQGSGKTTLLRAMARSIPAWETVVTIETEYELYLHEFIDEHPKVIAYEAKPGTGEYAPDQSMAGEITTKDLVRPALRQNASRIIVGEVRSAYEIGALVDVMQMGGGSMSTIHANNARQVIDRVTTFIGEQTGNYDFAERQVAELFHLVVFIGSRVDENGRQHRYITEILEVMPGDDGRAIGTPIFAPGPGKRAVPDIRPTFIEDLEEAGFDRNLLNHPAGLWDQEVEA